MENTVVVFFSDNGDLYGREQLSPFYGAKADLHEGGIRMPLIVRWSGTVRPGTVCSSMVASIDCLPTFAEMVGVRLADPSVDGITILPLADSSGGANPQHPVLALPTLSQAGPWTFRCGRSCRSAATGFEKWDEAERSAPPHHLVRLPLL